MKLKGILLLMTACLLQGSPGLLAQGSGDAGLATSGDFDARSRATDTPSRIYIMERAGLGPYGILTFQTEFQLDWNIWGGINLWFAVPYRFTLGELGTFHGLGDMRVAVSHTLAEAGDFTVKINVGGVIPSGYATREKEGQPLPMAYQAGVGSASFMVSSMFYYRSWNLSVGYQRQVAGNKNAFTKAVWDYDEAVADFPDSPGLWCGDDLVVRVRKDFDREKAQYSLSLLPAYRLNEDRIMIDGALTEVAGSSGFSMNASAAVELRLGKYGYFHFLAAAPVLKRDAYPDGLDRTVVVMTGFGVQFPE